MVQIHVHLDVDLDVDLDLDVDVDVDVDLGRLADATLRVLLNRCAHRGARSYLKNDFKL